LPTCGCCWLAGRRSEANYGFGTAEPGQKCHGKIRPPHGQSLPAAAFEFEHRPDFASALSQVAALKGSRRCGGGSSREAAVYALYDHGFRCVIAPSFGDIFAQNSVKNGLLTAIIPEEEIAKISAMLTADPEKTIGVDLSMQTISYSDQRCRFTIDPVSRNQLLKGWDDVDLTESYCTNIAAFNARDRKSRPWVRPTTT
jgi:3-isopropylmalate dehydratase small subunit